MLLAKSQIWGQLPGFECHKVKEPNDEQYVILTRSSPRKLSLDCWISMALKSSTRMGEFVIAYQSFVLLQGISVV